jgi:hypothetical protein
MPPQLLSLVIFGIQQLLTHEPEIAAEIHRLLSSGDPTAADWAALHAKAAAKGYLDYVKASALHSAAPTLAIPADVIVKVLPPPAAAPVSASTAASATPGNGGPTGAQSQTPAASQTPGPVTVQADTPIRAGVIPLPITIATEPAKA